MSSSVEVFKAGGVWASAANKEHKVWVHIRELPEGVQILVPDFKAPIMTVAEARSFAAQIMEAARRHEVRNSK